MQMYVMTVFSVCVSVCIYMGRITTTSFSISMFPYMRSMSITYSSSKKLLGSYLCKVTFLEMEMLTIFSPIVVLGPFPEMPSIMYICVFGDLFKHRRPFEPKVLAAIRYGTQFVITLELKAEPGYVHEAVTKSILSNLCVHVWQYVILNVDEGLSGSMDVSLKSIKLLFEISTIFVQRTQATILPVQMFMFISVMMQLMMYS